jgi:hypothetical protein
MKKPPSGLSRAAQKLWRELCREYSIEDSGGLAILETGLRAFDRMEAARRIIEAEGMQAPDRFGVMKPHGLLAAERDARGQWLAALKQLCLDVEPLQERHGRPNGR